MFVDWCNIRKVAVKVIKEFTIIKILHESGN